MRLFRLVRYVDESGVSGTGHVADGVVFWNGKCAVSWRTKHTSVAVYDDIETVEAIHGHNGQGRIEFWAAEKGGWFWLSLNEKERAVIKAAREQKRLYDKDGLLFEYRRACEKTNVSVAALDEALREGD